MEGGLSGLLGWYLWGGGVAPPPLLVPYHSRPCFGNTSAQLGCRAPGNKQNGLYLQAAVLTQVRKSMCDQKNTPGLPPLLGNPAASPGKPYLTLRKVHSPMVGPDFKACEQKPGTQKALAP